MDDRSFDRLARLLGRASDRRSGLKALAGILTGAGVLAAREPGADAKRTGTGDDRRRSETGTSRKKRTCRPACTDGFVCRKVGRRRACVCEGGPACGATCCAAGQVCQDGACVAQPQPDRCIAAGQPCVDSGRACCDGRVCASGQAGLPDVACYVPQAGPCTRTDDCVYGTECRGGACHALPPAPLPTVSPQPTETPLDPVSGLGVPCDPATQVCTSTGADCQAYASAVPGASPGSFCLLNDGAASTDRTHCAGRALDRAGLCLTCTVYRGAHASDEAALAAVKAAIESTAADAPNPVAIGTGLYKPASGITNTTLITADRGSDAAPLRLVACYDGTADRAVLDGGADVTKTGGTILDTDNASLLTWANGNRILQITAGKTVAISEIDFQHANSSAISSDNAGGAIASAGKLTLSRLKVRRCKGTQGGGVYATDETQLESVELSQCTGTVGGGIRGNARRLTFGKADPGAPRCSIAYNRATTSGGGVAMQDSSGGPGALLDLRHTDLTGNSVGTTANHHGGGLWIYLLNGTATIDDVTFTGNSASGSAGGLRLLVTAGNQGTGATLTNTRIENNSASTGGGILNTALSGNFGKLILGSGTTIAGNSATTQSPGVENQGAGTDIAIIECPNGTTAKVCGNPDAGAATGATNCGGAGTYTGCTAVCRSSPATC